MNLKKLSLKNIRSYRKEEIEFPKGSILLSGDIGSGKTSILMAVEYALFGLQPGQKGSSLLRDDANMGAVSLEFEINGKEILIERKLRRNNKSVANEYSAITINGKKIESSLTEIKAKILKELGYPSEFIKKNNLLYKYTVYTPQENMKQIILEDPEVRLNILRHIMGIDKYKKIRGNLVILSTYLKEYSKLLQGEIKYLDEDKAKIEFKKNLLHEIERRINEKNSELNSCRNKKGKVEFEISQLEDKIRQKEYFEKEIEKTNVMLSTKYESLSSINLELSDLRNTILEEQNVFDEDEYKNILSLIRKKCETIDALNSRKVSLIARINSLENTQKESLLKKERIFRIEICPTCLQDVPELHKHNIMNETEGVLGEIQRSRMTSERELTSAIQAITRENSEKEKMEEKKTALEILRTRSEFLKKTKERLENVAKIKETIENDISWLKKHISDLESQIEDFSKYSSFFMEKKEEFQKTLQEEKKIEISIAELGKEADLTKKEIEDLQESVKIKESSRQKLSDVLELHDWLSTNFVDLIDFTERNVLMKLREEFSKLFTKWFHSLVYQDSFDVRLDESFSPIIMHNESEMDYSSLSGGERTAVALAYRLALNQTLNSILSRIKTKGFIILDEPTDGFSETQLEKIRHILDELNASQLLIVSHEQKIEGFVDNVIKIKKSGDVSSVESSSLSPPSKTLDPEKLIELKETPA